MRIRQSTTGDRSTVTRHRRKQVTCAATIAVAMAGLTSPANTYAADPLLTLDLRVHGTGGKTATVSNIGDVVTLDLFAVVHNGDGNASNERFQSTAGSYLSSPGGLEGNLSTLNPSPLFILHQAGTQNDLDADGDLDVGGTNPENVNGFVVFTGTDSHPVSPGGLYLGQVQFTALDFSGGLTTDVNWLYRNRTTGTIGLKQLHGFFSDGVRYSEVGSSSRIAVGSPVSISYTGPTTPPDNTREFDIWDINSAETNPGGTVLANHIRVGVMSPGSYAQSSGFTHASNVTVGASAGATGSWTQTGGNVLAGTVTVGGAGSGTASLAGGTATYSDLHLGTNGGGTGTLTIANDAQLLVTGITEVRAGTSSALNQSGGTTTFSGGLALATGSVAVSGGTLSGRNLAYVGGPATFTQTGGNVTIESISLPTAATGARYELQQGQLRTTYLSLGGTYHQTGGQSDVMTVAANSLEGSRIELSGGQANWDLVRIGHASAGATNATLTQTGGTLLADQLDVSPKGRIELSGTSSLNIRQRLTNAGVIDLSGAPVTLGIGDGAFVDFARYGMTSSSATPRHIGGQLINAINATINAGKNSFISFPAGFDIEEDLGTLNTQGIVHIEGMPVTVAAGKSIGGSGGIAGDVTNHGVIAPGNSPGSLAIEGNYAQSPTGSLVMEIAGTEAEMYDFFSVSGSALLDGTLEVALLDGFVPSAGDSFTILTAGSLSGTFDNALSSITTPQGTFDVTYSSAGVTLSNFAAVPEPTSAAVVAVAACAVSMTRRRSRKA